MLALEPTRPPWLSILLPVFQVERYLADLARSLLSQDLEGVEVLFLDDASPDSSMAVLRRLRDEHGDRIRLLQHPMRRGVSAARNTLLDAARGERLWFVDPDDVVEPGAVARLRRIVTSHDPDLVMCDFRVFDDATGAPVDRGDDHVASFRGPSGVLTTDRDALVRGLFLSGKLHPWSKVVRRRAWPAALRFPEGRLFEDLSLMPRVLRNARSFFHAGEVWVAYRRRPESTMGRLTRSKLDDWMAALPDATAALREPGIAFSEATYAAAAHFCATTWMHVGALAEALPSSDGEERRRRYAALWEAACPWPAARIERAYWRSGRLRRALRWRRWSRRPGR